MPATHLLRSSRAVCCAVLVVASFRSDRIFGQILLTMKYLPLLLTVATAATALAAAVVQDPSHQDVLAPTEQYLIEIEPGNTRWVTEKEKWALKRVCRMLQRKIEAKVNVSYRKASTSWTSRNLDTNGDMS